MIERIPEPPSRDVARRAFKLMTPGFCSPTGLSLREAAAQLYVPPSKLDLALWRNLGRRV